MNSIAAEKNKSYKILVTGASGFIGRAFIQTLNHNAHAVYGLDLHFPDSLKNYRLKDFYTVDLTKPFELKGSFDFVFHLAGYNVTHVGPREESLYLQVNVEGTKNLLKAAPIKNFIFLSTSKVYKNEGKVINEDSKVAPENDYEKSKLQAEIICQKYFKGSHLTILRSVNIVGPGQSAKAVIPVFFENALAGKPLNIFVPGETHLQFVAVSDLIELFKATIEHGGLSGIFNVAPNEKIRIDELASQIIQLCGSRSKINFSNSSSVLFSEVDSKKINTALGWQTQRRLSEILKECLPGFKGIKNE